MNVYKATDRKKGLTVRRRGYLRIRKGFARHKLEDILVAGGYEEKVGKSHHESFSYFLLSSCVISSLVPGLPYHFINLLSCRQAIFCS